MCDGPTHLLTRGPTVARGKPPSGDGAATTDRRARHRVQARLASLLCSSGHWNWILDTVARDGISIYNRSPVVQSARHAVGRFRCLETLVSGLLFVAFVIAFVGLAATAGMHSLLLTLACAAAVVGTLAVLAAWTLVIHDRPKHLTDLPRHVAWHPRQWAEFERPFWSHVDGSWDSPPRATE